MDSTHAETRYKEDCLEPAAEILRAIVEGRAPPVAPLEKAAPVDNFFEAKKRLFRCEVCDRNLPGSVQYEEHLRSRKHHSQVKLGEPRFNVVIGGAREGREEVARKDGKV